MNNHLEDIRNWRVLVVDDSVELTEIVTHVLTSKGAQVIVANTGKDAYNLLIDEQPTFILLDLTLPDTDGFALLNTLRSQLQIACPVIAFTARSHAEALDLTNQGFDAFVLKPFRMNTFVERLSGILKQLE